MEDKVLQRAMAQALHENECNDQKRDMTLDEFRVISIVSGGTYPVAQIHVRSRTESLGGVMKPFNLQEALAGKPLVTRDGRKVTHFRYFPEADKHAYSKSLVGIIDGVLHTWCNIWPGTPYGYSPNDLFMASEKKEGWVNLYHSSDPDRREETFVGAVYPTEDACNRMAMKERLITSVKISWEE